MDQPNYYGGYQAQSGVPPAAPFQQQYIAAQPGAQQFPPVPMPGMPPNIPPGPMPGFPIMPPVPPAPAPPAQQYTTPPSYGQQQQQQPFGQQNFNNLSKPSPAVQEDPKKDNRDIIENQVFVTNLDSSNCPTVEDIKERFGSIGVIKMDKRTRTPRIKVWEEKGCASITYEDPSAASAAIQWFNQKEFKGAVIGVEFATKAEEWSGGRRGGGNSGGFGGRGGFGGGGRGGGYGGRGGGGGGGGRDFSGDRRGGGGGGGRDRSRSPRRRSRSPGGRGGDRGGGDRGGRGGEKEGDWTCQECNNSNFARRSECNRCKAPKEGGRSGGGGGRSGGYSDRRGDRDSHRGGDRDRRDDRGRGGRDSGGGRDHGVRDGDWPCKSCGANNFARRTDCFKCHERK